MGRLFLLDERSDIRGDIAVGPGYRFAHPGYCRLLSASVQPAEHVDQYENRQGNAEHPQQQITSHG
jgi:hypothetical protein